MITRKFITILLAAITATASAQTSVMKESDLPANASYVPPKGFVPDKSTAETVAIAVLTPIYGKSNILRQRPFQVNLRDDIWTVRGTLPHHMVGGVAEIRISKTTGEILRVIHTK